MDNLHHVLKDIYYMTNRMRFSAEYVESVSPVERQMYIRYFIEYEKKRQEKESGFRQRGRGFLPTSRLSRWSGQPVTVPCHRISTPASCSCGQTKRPSSHVRSAVCGHRQRWLAGHNRTVWRVAVGSCGFPQRSDPQSWEPPISSSGVQMTGHSKPRS